VKGNVVHLNLVLIVNDCEPGVWEVDSIRAASDEPVRSEPRSATTFA
jgi:hypothetical protein